MNFGIQELGAFWAESFCWNNPLLANIKLLQINPIQSRGADSAPAGIWSIIVLYDKKLGICVISIFGVLNKWKKTGVAKKILKNMCSKIFFSKKIKFKILKGGWEVEHCFAKIL